MKRILNLCINKNFMPYSDIVDGKFVGFIADYMVLVENSIKNQLNLFKQHH